MILDRRQPRLLDFRAPHASPYSIEIKSRQNPDSTTNMPNPLTSGNSNNQLKTVIVFVMLAVALLGLATFVIRRFRNKRPVTTNHFFNVGQHYSAFLPPSGPSISYPIATGMPPLLPRSFPLNRHPEPRHTAVPAVYLGSGQHINSAYVSDGWRMIESLRLSPHVRLGDKDALPAYDKTGGPPNYVDLNAMPIQPVPPQCDGRISPPEAHDPTQERDLANISGTEGEGEGTQSNIEQHIDPLPTSSSTTEEPPPTYPAQMQPVLLV
ncbi:uncharacterized protein LACBIDRAFT_315125 [Laccaria bicolor S238N-H82]|uniref:Predicted protein n=1 Tax=Laccaria bicolor (strain S238N-H82 / ATCC MYA-4686) TaxID=486041 RepID=B0DZW0_LACBS|nr:uncharacterized protein LACBIDRAFT_315125 [Laccaria bicolor S238N-H82]EDQ99939.1 predicted protein [Laccaria bicolor S238N-H82]|eukprot:XP_001889482.1 predicted protein [Laccaria bicolor S238N-H82]